MNHYKSLRELLLDVLNTLHHAEILASAVFLHSEEAASVHIVGMNVNNEKLQILELAFRVVVVAEQLLDQLRLCLLESDVVGIAAEDVLELALELVDIVVMLSSELELHLLVSGLASLLLLCTLVEILAQIIDDSVIVVTVLFPKLTQLFLIRFFHLHNSISNFESLL